MASPSARGDRIDGRTDAEAVGTNVVSDERPYKLRTNSSEENFLIGKEKHYFPNKSLEDCKTKTIMC